MLLNIKSDLKKYFVVGILPLFFLLIFSNLLQNKMVVASVHIVFIFVQLFWLAFKKIVMELFVQNGNKKLLIKLVLMYVLKLIIIALCFYLAHRTGGGAVFFALIGYLYLVFSFFIIFRNNLYAK